MLAQLSVLEIRHLRRQRQAAPAAGELRPAAIQPPLDAASVARDRQVGERLLREGRVAVVLLAGGQGSRLGHDAPKGTYPIGPLSKDSFFARHAQAIGRRSERAGRTVPWWIMTSPATDVATREFFAEHDFFGLRADSITFFSQSTLPALHSGRLALERKNRVFVHPDGHGGFFRAFAGAGGLESCRDAGIEQLFVHQVDNPLTPVADPVFLGRHSRVAADMSFKVVAKNSPDEGLGTPVEIDDGEHGIVEYSDLPAAEGKRRSADGKLIHAHGTIGVYALSTTLVSRVAAQHEALPYHSATRRALILDEHGDSVDAPLQKSELFLFDALAEARAASFVEVQREREFAPVKSMTGRDSVAAARRALLREHTRWVYGTNDQEIFEISPRCAVDEDDWHSRGAHMSGTERRHLDVRDGRVFPTTVG